MGQLAFWFSFGPRCPEPKLQQILLPASVAIVHSKIGENRFLFFFANIYSVPPGVGAFPAHIQVLPSSPLREHGFEFLLEGRCEPFWVSSPSSPESSLHLHTMAWMPFQVRHAAGCRSHKDALERSLLPSGGYWLEGTFSNTDSKPGRLLSKSPGEAQVPEHQLESDILRA